LRIFGYTNPAARMYAEKLGIAFQLTNILRDVKEDASRRRIYLPLEDLAHFQRHRGGYSSQRVQSQLRAPDAVRSGACA